MNLKEIETIVTVSKSRSFYEAAFMLNYSPSVITKHVSNVEKELGVELFIRGNRAQSISLTKDGEHLIPDFIRIHESFLQLESNLAALQKDSEGLLRIGASGHVSSIGRDEIFANFLWEHPGIRIEQTKHNFETLVHMMYSGMVDGVFLIVQNGSPNIITLNNLLADPKIESFYISREPDMYLGISDKDPLAEKSAAPLVDFQDFSIVFHTDQDILVKAGTIEPFVRLSKKSGFELKPIFLEPRDTSTFYLATKTKIAIPALRSSFEYPGIKFIKVSDWDTFSLSYFLALKANSGKMLANFIKHVRKYSKPV
jgi:hypothetical protein